MDDEQIICQRRSFYRRLVLPMISACKIRSYEAGLLGSQKNTVPFEFVSVSFIVDFAKSEAFPGCLNFEGSMACVGSSFSTSVIPTFKLCEFYLSTIYVSMMLFKNDL
jgi:hypothetical protein